MSFDFDEKYLRNLTNDEVQGDFTPFNKGDVQKVNRSIKGMLGRLKDKKNLIVEADFHAYGSGFASYINVKISKKNNSDSVIQKNGNKTEVSTKGILLYICSLAPYWYFGGVKWYSSFLNDKSQSGTIPFLNPQDIRKYDTELWAHEIEYITRLFEEYRYTLLTEQEVEKPLWFDVDIKANMGDKPYTVFDCFFHWED